MNQMIREEVVKTNYSKKMFWLSGNDNAYFRECHWIAEERSLIVRFLTDFFLFQNIDRAFHSSARLITIFVHRVNYAVLKAGRIILQHVYQFVTIIYLFICDYGFGLCGWMSGR